MRSRSWKAYRKGVKAPTSIAVVPSHRRWLKIRFISMQMSRTTLQRSVTSMPMSFSTAITYTQL